MMAGDHPWKGEPEMSKAKKAAYAAKQKAAAGASTARELSPLSENAPMPKAAKKTHTRKQSRGK
jgi:hypothetical protein